MKFTAAAVQHPHFEEFTYSGPTHAEATFDAETEWGTEAYSWPKGYIGEDGKFYHEADALRLLANPFYTSEEVLNPEKRRPSAFRIRKLKGKKLWEAAP